MEDLSYRNDPTCTITFIFPKTKQSRALWSRVCNSVLSMKDAFSVANLIAKPSNENSFPYMNITTDPLSDVYFLAFGIWFEYICLICIKVTLNLISRNSRFRVPLQIATQALVRVLPYTGRLEMYEAPCTLPCVMPGYDSPPPSPITFSLWLD